MASGPANLTAIKSLARPCERLAHGENQDPGKTFLQHTGTEVSKQ